MKIYTEHTCAVCKRTVMAVSDGDTKEWVRVDRGDTIDTACPKHAPLLLAERDGRADETLQVAAKAIYLAAKTSDGDAREAFDAAAKALVVAIALQREAAALDAAVAVLEAP